MIYNQQYPTRWNGASKVPATNNHRSGTMKLKVQQIAQFDADAKLVHDFVAEAANSAGRDSGSTLKTPTAADHAAERIRKLARELMGAEVKVSG